MNSNPKKPLKPLFEVVIPDTPNIKCDHYFEFVEDGVKCNKCHMGLLGVVELKNGKPVI